MTSHRPPRALVLLGLSALLVLGAACGSKNNRPALTGDVVTTTTTTTSTTVAP